MFFTDIANWTKSKLRTFWIVFNVLYLCATLVAPCIIVGCKYQIFVHVSQYKLTGWGMVLAIFVFIVGIRTLNKVLKNLPESTINEQRVKYTCLGVKALAIPIFVLIIMRLFKSNFDLAYETLWWCLLCYTIGILIDYLCIHYLDRELELRKKAKEVNEINKRVANLNN